MIFFFSVPDRQFLSRLFQETDIWIDSRHLHRIKDLDSCETVMWEIYEKEQEEEE